MTLRVTLEIVPFGVEEDKHTIETINISNIGKLNNLLHSYAVEHNEYKQFMDKPTDKVMKVYHNREDGALVLVSKALDRILRN